MSFKVQNWPAYEAGLRGRGSLTLWIEETALECRQTCGPSGHARWIGDPDKPDGARGIQWLETKHGAKARRKWRKLHLAVDAASGMIVAQTVTVRTPTTHPRWRRCSIRLMVGLVG